MKSIGWRFFQEIPVVGDTPSKQWLLGSKIPHKKNKPLRRKPGKSCFFAGRTPWDGLCDPQGRVFGKISLENTRRCGPNRISSRKGKVLAVYSQNHVFALHVLYLICMWATLKKRFFDSSRVYLENLLGCLRIKPGRIIRHVLFALVSKLGMDAQRLKLVRLSAMMLKAAQISPDVAQLDLLEDLPRTYKQKDLFNKHARRLLKLPAAKLADALTDIYRSKLK